PPPPPPPDEFIPFAERSGLILGIGAWVIREACRQAAEWTDAGPGDLKMITAVNVSGRQLVAGAGLVESVKAALDEYGPDPENLILEVTESALLEDAEAALRVVKELKRLGVGIAIDDFGTGYSSLLYLKRFPVDLLKVDRTFVSGLGQSQEDTAITRSIIDLAHSFGISAVAEGIETRAQLDVLRSMGCTYGQGFLWSPGLPPAELGNTFTPNHPARHRSAGTTAT
ncbi:MAG: EAL domain-containing protein, partial [Actinomycetes bacterium]